MGDYVQNVLIKGLIGTALLFPYAFRLRLMGWLMRKIVGPMAGYRQRADQNLALIWPEQSKSSRDAIACAALDNAGRTLIENYSTTEFIKRQAACLPTGPGLIALQQASDAKKPVILVSGHYGNYEAARASLVSRGFMVGGLYRAMSNRFFNAHYEKTMQAFGGPVFAQGRSGTAGFVRHLKSGGQLVLLFDQHVYGAPQIDFLGKPAHTAFSAAELALRYDALLIPFFATRQSDGLTFDVEFLEPIPATNAQDMTKAISNALERKIIEHPGQWFWVHNRWK
jgi:KDO2-lipid IV(A) lauroyltransferase